MNAAQRIKQLVVTGLGIAAIVLAGCASMSSARQVSVSLSGAEEVPPVSTSATARGAFTVNEDRSVSGSVTVAGLSPVAAHIHTGARGKNGPVAIGMVKTSGDTWSIPAGAKFDEAQYKAFLSGETYVNFHTPANKGGEIRAQLKP